MTLRWYQQEAFDAAVAWMRRCIDPALIELPTGSGKSHVVSAIAEWSHHESGKKVLCLAPSKELTEQNFEKYQIGRASCRERVEIPGGAGAVEQNGAGARTRRRSREGTDQGQMVGAEN